FVPPFTERKEVKMRNTDISGYLVRVLFVLLVAGIAVAPVLGEEQQDTGIPVSGMDEESGPGVAAPDGEGTAIVMTSTGPVAVEDLVPPYPPGWEPSRSSTARDGGGLYPATAFDPSSNTLILHEGWNLVSTPLWLADGHDTIAVFDDVDTASHSILWYNGSNGDWELIGPQEEFRPLEGIWIYANESYQIPLYFKPVEEQTGATNHLYPGWNLVGFYGLSQESARDTLISLRNAWTTAIGYDAETQDDEVSMIRGATGSHSDQRLMFPGKAYWVYMTDEATLVPLKATKDYHDLDYPQVGVEWVDNYDFNWQNPLSQSSNTSRGFYNTLVEEGGWIPMFEYGDHEVKGDHFFVNGSDQQYIDGVDVALFAGHGWSQWLVLSGVLEVMPYINCNWGDYDLEWIFLHGCHTTEDPDIFKMSVPYRTMNGVHLICGFATVGWDMNDGENLAHELLNGETVIDAWFHATDMTHDPPIALRVIGENEACGNDHIWGSGVVTSDPPVDQYYWIWDYDCR
ncbi:MAG: DUF6345 domain-containing protein, partial [Candidatus Methanomethylophilaceae archaeon]|nr:DUF6345 domain-containing protein [Candidatus Methanomethylophilaceae archaeon]